MSYWGVKLSFEGASADDPTGRTDPDLMKVCEGLKQNIVEREGITVTLDECLSQIQLWYYPLQHLNITTGGYGKGAEN